MWKDLQLTLYEIFGYLLPGVLILFAITLLFWTLFWPSSPLTFPSQLPYLAITTLLFLTYLVGNLGQAVANLVTERLKNRVRLEATLPLSPELSQLVRQAVASRFGESARNISPQELFHLCDQALVHYGSVGEREIFTYREGFYRGNSVALALVTLTIVVRLFRRPILIGIQGTSWELGRWQLALAATFTGLGTFFAFQRYLRFAKHQRRSCYLRFLALDSEKHQETGVK